MQRPGARNDLGDVDGVRVGHHHRFDDGWGTGTTAVLLPEGTVGSVAVRGGGPATRETDALAPDTMVQTVDALCLTGGSAYGLDTASGVMVHCEENRRGFRVGPEAGQIVPIVAAAALFDLGVVGEFGNRPDASFGHAAAMAAASGASEPGSVGAGADDGRGLRGAAVAGRGSGGAGGRTEATSGIRPGGVGFEQGSVGTGAGATSGILRGGLGSASAVLESGATVAALVAVNAAGSPVDPSTGILWGARHGLGEEFAHLRLPDPEEVAAFGDRLEAARAARASLFNTTLAIIVTDALLTKSECHRLAAAGHDGMARALDPIHGYVDGDIVFGCATGAVPLGSADAPLRPEGARLMALGDLLAAATSTVTRAIVHATLAATGVDGFPSYGETFPSALP